MGKSMLVGKLMFAWAKGDGFLILSLVYESSSCKQAIIDEANHGRHQVLLTADLKALQHQSGSEDYQSYT